MRTAAARSGRFHDLEDVNGLIERIWLPSEYNLLGTLGRGSFGVVLEVEHLASGTIMAAKRVQLLAPPRGGSS